MGSIKKTLRSQRLEINWSVPYLFSGRLKIWRYCYILRCINVISTLYQLLYQRRFLLDLSIIWIPQTPMLRTFHYIYIFEASAVNHPPPSPNYFKKRGDGIILKIDKIKKVPICKFEMRNVFLSDSKNIYDIKLKLLFLVLCSFSEIHGGQKHDIAK